MAVEELHVLMSFLPSLTYPLHFRYYAVTHVSFLASSQVSFTTSLAVVELQQPPDSTSVTPPLQEVTVLCNDRTSPEGGDKACVLLLQPLSNANHGPADHEDPGLKTHLDDQECDSVLDIPPPSTIIYDAGDSCEGSPLLPQVAPPSLPVLTESTF